MIRDLVEEHLEEGAFLWTQWERALVSPRYQLAEVAAGPEERLVAHLEGLSVAGADELQPMLGEALGGNDPGRVFAAALPLLNASANEDLELSLAATEKRPEQRTALTRAMGLCQRRSLEPVLISLLQSPHLAAQASALEALAFRRIGLEAKLRPFILEEQPDVTPAALRAARTSGEAAHSLVEHALTSAVAPIRDAAIETGLMLGLRSAWARARQAVEQVEDGIAFPLAVMAMSGDPADLALVERAASDSRLRGSALCAFAAGGTFRTAELCLEHLDDPSHGRLAGEAFSAITGLRIEGELERQEAELDRPIPFEEEHLEADLHPGPDDELPLPRSDEILHRWRQICPAQSSYGRLLGGKPFALERLLETLATGSMRRRRLAALELAIRSHGECTLETRTWARRQQRAFSTIRLTVRFQLLQPFSRLLRV